MSLQDDYAWKLLRRAMKLLGMSQGYRWQKGIRKDLLIYEIEKALDARVEHKDAGEIRAVYEENDKLQTEVKNWKDECISQEAELIEQDKELKQALKRMAHLWSFLYWFDVAAVHRDLMASWFDKENKGLKKVYECEECKQNKEMMEELLDDINCGSIDQAQKTLRRYY